MTPLLAAAIETKCSKSGLPHTNSPHRYAVGFVRQPIFSDYQASAGHGGTVKRSSDLYGVRIRVMNVKNLFAILVVNDQSTQIARMFYYKRAFFGKFISIVYYRSQQIILVVIDRGADPQSLWRFIQNERRAIADQYGVVLTIGGSVGDSVSARHQNEGIGRDVRSGWGLSTSIWRRRFIGSLQPSLPRFWWGDWAADQVGCYRRHKQYAGRYKPWLERPFSKQYGARANNSR